MNALLRVRVVIIGVAMGVVAAAASSIFDRWVWSLGLAVVVPTVVVMAIRAMPLIVRVTGALVAVVAGVGLIVLVEGGQTGDAVDALVSGVQRLLTSEWPSPDHPDVIGAVGAFIAAATAAATTVAGQRRWHLLAWVPVLAAFVVSVALAAPHGARLVWLVPLGVLGAAFASLRPEAPLGERWATLRGERRLVPLLLVAGVTAGAVSLPVSLAVRADPRRNDPAEETAALLDPIESTLALRALDPPIDLHRIRSTAADGTDTALPLRWRTAALSDYDGQRWTPALTLRPIGRRLAPDAAEAISFELSFLDDDLTLVPLPGAPVTVGADVETDPDRTVVRLVDRRDDDSPIEISARVAPSLADAQLNGVATRPVDDSVSSLNEFAATLAGDGTVVEQLRRIEATMREDWILEPDAPGGGLQRALIERFMRDTRRGTAEQFATAYVLLARSLGIDARVATGFVASSPSADGTIELTSADALVWPEVRVVGGGWVALDPTPEEEASDLAPPPEDPAVQTPAAAQPPIAPPPEVSNDSANDEAVQTETSSTASALRLWAVRAGLALSGVLLPILLAAALVLGVKRRRRRRRLLSGLPADRVTGAWAVATDWLVDAGLTIRSSATDGDIAASGEPLAGGAARELGRLAALSSAVTFGHPARPDLLAQDAATCLAQVETSMNASRSGTERLRWRLSLRSLRRSTRSPVAD